MKNKVSERGSKAQRFLEIAKHLENAGQVGMRVAGVARAIQKSKSYTHKLLSEMVNFGLIEKEVTYTDSDVFHVNYVYYQLPLWLGDGNFSGWDGITGECSNCGKDMVGERGMCSSCRQVWNG